MRSLAFVGLVASLALMSAPAAAGSDSKIAEGSGTAARAGTIAYDYDFAARERVTGTEGTWSGHWEGRYVDAANGRYEGVFRGTYQAPAAPVQPYAAYAYPAAPGYPAGQPAYGYGNAGYGVPVYVPMQPMVTKTITVVEEEIIND